jgi:GR25 family glycosyltransferase involved in LPS biosynthesis
MTFDRVVVINLQRRPDRLAAFLVRWSAISDNPQSALRTPQLSIFPALDGHAVEIPPEWQSGPGAFGCMQSHRAVLAQALVDGVERLLVLEDDAVFVPHFPSRLAAFLAAVPSDWDQLMLGGHHLSTPIPMGQGIVRVTACGHNHCYAMRPAFMARLLDRWRGGGPFNGQVHCDWIMSQDPELQAAHHVYAPEPFLVTQATGRSDISTPTPRRSRRRI